MKVQSNLKGMTAAKHRRLRGNVWRHSDDGGHSCVMMWRTTKDHWLNSAPWQKTWSSVAFETCCWSCRNILQCAEAGADVDMCTGDGVVSWFCRRLLLVSCQLTSNVRNRVTAAEVLFFSFRKSSFYSVLCWIMHVCSFKCQCRLKKMWQTAAIIFFQQ